MQLLEPFSSRRISLLTVRCNSFGPHHGVTRDPQNCGGRLIQKVGCRIIAQQASEDVDQATEPFQFALSTRAACECVSHVVQTLLEIDENTTLLSVDGVGAFDLISRKAMIEGLLDMPNGDQFLLFVRLCGSPSIFSWEDEMGTVNQLRPPRRGVRTRRSVNAPPLLSWTTSRSVAFLDDVHVATGSPATTVDAHNILREEMWRAAVRQKVLKFSKKQPSQRWIPRS